MKASEQVKINIFKRTFFSNVSNKQKLGELKKTFFYAITQFQIEIENTHEEKRKKLGALGLYQLVQRHGG